MISPTNISKKCTAFTLVEVLVALVLTGIVASIFGLAYYYTVKQFNLFTGKSHDVTDHLIFDKTLKIDIQKAESAQIDDYGNLQLNNISYVFDSNATVRITALRNDTFPIIVESYNIKELQIEESILIEKLTIMSSSPIEDVHLHYTKHYSAQSLFNQIESIQ